MAKHIKAKLRNGVEEKLFDRNSNFNPRTHCIQKKGKELHSALCISSQISAFTFQLILVPYSNSAADKNCLLLSKPWALLLQGQNVTKSSVEVFPDHSTCWEQAESTSTASETPHSQLATVPAALVSSSSRAPHVLPSAAREITFSLGNKLGQIAEIVTLLN